MAISKRDGQPKGSSLQRVAAGLALLLAGAGCIGAPAEEEQAEDSQTDAGASVDVAGSVEQALNYPSRGAFAWINLPIRSGDFPSQSGVPDPLYSSGISSVISPGGWSAPNGSKGTTGAYRVTVKNGASAVATAGWGNPQVVAYGTSNNRCMVHSWDRSTVQGAENDLDIWVTCSTPAGAPTDSAFVIQWQLGADSGGGAYLWANEPSAALNTEYVPSAAHSFNSAGANRVTRTATGAYTVKLGGQSALGGTFEVTASGASKSHCKVSNWYVSGSDTLANVRCFSTTGAAADSPFSLNYTPPSGAAYKGKGGYAWANNPTSASYAPYSLYSYNSGRCITLQAGGSPLGTNTATRSAVGRYSMQHTRLPFTGTTAHVTAYGASSSYCKVESWYRFGDLGAEVKISCFDATGAPVDSQYVETYWSSDSRSMPYDMWVQGRVPQGTCGP